jgi:hypothetical protein
MPEENKDSEILNVSKEYFHKIMESSVRGELLSILIFKGELKPCEFREIYKKRRGKDLSAGSFYHHLKVMKPLLQKREGKIMLKPSYLSIVLSLQQFDQVYGKIMDGDKEIDRLRRSYEERITQLQKEIDRLKEENSVLQKIKGGKVLDYVYRLENCESDRDISLLRYTLNLILDADTGSSISLSSKKLARFFNDFIKARKASLVLQPILDNVIKEYFNSSQGAALIYHFTVTDGIKQRAREYEEKLGINL